MICRMFFAPSLVHGCALLDKFMGEREGKKNQDFISTPVCIMQSNCLCYLEPLDSQSDLGPGHDRFKNALVLKLLFQCDLVSLCLFLSDINCFSNVVYTGSRSSTHLFYEL